MVKGYEPHELKMEVRFFHPLSNALNDIYKTFNTCKFMDFFESEKRKEFEAIGFKNQRRNLRQLPQTQKGKTDKVRDKERHALLPGKRISKTGKIYWETRTNRSDSSGSNL